jgi:Flp pilus assembly pilin Flp
MNRGLTIARQEENGQTMAEYALVLGFITLVIVTAIGTLSDGVAAALGRVVGLFS